MTTKVSLASLFDKDHRKARELLCDILNVTDDAADYPRWVLMGNEVPCFPGQNFKRGLADAYDYLKWLSEGQRRTLEEVLAETQRYLERQMKSAAIRTSVLQDVLNELQ